MEARSMSIFTPVTWLWTLPHHYGRPWVWTIFVAFLTVFFFLRWQAWFTAVIHARLIVEFVLCYRDLKRIEARHRRERHEQTRAHIANCRRCRELQKRIGKSSRVVDWGFSC